MKILTVSDIHEKYDILLRAITKFKTENYDKVIFMMDVCDAWKHSDKVMIACLNLVIDFKKEFTDQVVLLRANHENGYRYYPDYRCSGFQSSCQLVAQQILIDNDKLFNWYYFHEGYLFTHAGVTNKWLNQVSERFRFYDSNDSLFETLDNLPQTQQGLDLLNQCGSLRGGDKYDAGGLTWCDKRELTSDAYFDNLVKFQVVGHTAVPEIQFINNCYFTDCLNSKEDFLTLNF